MKTFRWVELLLDQRVPFVEKGANVKRGEINIRCPFCGSADPSYHMGINLESGWWSCWRNKTQHSGKSPLRLLMRLLDVPYWKAREIAGLSNDYVDPEGFDAVAARIMGRNAVGRPEEIQRRHLSIDKRFIPIANKRVRTRRFWNYLYRRGFYGDDVDPLCEDYGLHCATEGPFCDRVIIPYYLEGELVAWTGRAIGDAAIRYRDLEHDKCLVPPKEMLFNGDCIAAGGKALVLVEGPFDVLKGDFYARDDGVRFVGLSTNSITEEQCYHLQAAASAFERFIVMLDTATMLGVVDSMRLKQELYFLPNLCISPTPFQRKDVGEMTPREISRWSYDTRHEIAR